MNDRRIVVADDDPNLLSYFRSIFEHDNSLDFFDTEESCDSFTVHTFSDGAPLVEYFRSEYAEGRRIPICILDMRMPAMDGLSAAEAVRAVDPEVFIIIVTAYTDVSAAEIRNRLKEDIYYVKKPFCEDDLYSLVSSLFANWSTRQALRESEKLYRELVQQLNEGIICLDAEANVSLVNDKMCNMLAYTEDEILGRPIHSIVAERCWDILDEKLEWRRAGKHFRYDVEMVAKDGRIITTLASITPKFNERGVYQGSLGIVADITQRIQMEKELLAAKEQAELANRAKSQFLANMSHEIRTPMNGIMGMTELLLSTQMDRHQRDMAQNVMICGKALLNIINDILDFSKIEAGRLELESVDFRLQDVIAEVENLFALQAEEKGLDLVFEMENIGRSFLRGDPGRLRQILINVVGNALKFTVRGRVLVRAKLRPQARELYEAIFEVHDTGPGIPLDAQDRIFNSFSQADNSTTRRYGGTGLGLAICKQLCDLMEGTIYFTSTPDEGSIFRFTAMLKKGGPCRAICGESAASERSSGSPVERPGISAQPLTGKERSTPQFSARVLVAEDTSINREFLNYFLESLGIEIDLVQDGREALQAVSKVKYDLILMDCQMPEMDGYEATRRIRAQENARSSPTAANPPDQDPLPAPHREVPIIALTANAMEGDREKCLAAGMNDYLAKPFGLKDITQVLQRWLPPRAR